MSKSGYKVTYEQSKYTSVFYVDELDASYEDQLFNELRNVSYGDGKFYLKKYGDRIGRIIFETDDAYYVEEDFAKTHAKKISDAIAKVARQIGTINTLKN